MKKIYVATYNAGFDFLDQKILDSRKKAINWLAGQSIKYGICWDKNTALLEVEKQVENFNPNCNVFEHTIK